MLRTRPPLSSPCTLRRALLLAALALLAWAPSALAADRPTTPSQDPSSYQWPESVYAGQRVVVHYETQGLAAPPLADENGDGVPDYVKEVADTGDAALAAYAGLGFPAPLPDRGGPDSRVDIYISALGGQGCGWSASPAESPDGAFVVVSQLLDRGSDGNPGAGRALCSLKLTVAHELFHVVQFAYPRFSSWPGWLVESTASAAAGTLYPEVDDAILDNHLSLLPSEPVTLCQLDPYGASFFWSTVADIRPRFLPLYLAQATAPQGSCGYHQLDQVFRAQGTSLAASYQDAAIEHPDDLPSQALKPGVWSQGTLAPLAGRVLYLSPRAGQTQATLELGTVKGSQEGSQKRSEKGLAPAQVVFWVDGRIRRLARGQLTLPLDLGPESSVSVAVTGQPFSLSSWRLRVLLR